MPARIPPAVIAACSTKSRVPRRTLASISRGWLAAVAVDAGIHDPEFNSLQPCKYADGRAAGEEILDHLFGHRARIGADAAVRHAVIRGEYDRHRMHDRGFERSLHGTHLSRERLETAESTQWFRQ